MSNIPPSTIDVTSAFNGTLDSVELLRAGGQAVVYKARRLVTTSGVEVGDNVALKLYFDSAQDDRVTREIEAATSVRSDCLGNLISHGYVEVGTKRYRYLVWSFIEGIALDSYLSVKVATPRLAVAIGRDVSRAIEAIWLRRIVHRDVNPKNVMLRKGLEAAVLIDLGVAKYIEQAALTAAGMTWGTIGYLSPEQAAGWPLTCQSDIFSLGVTLQECLHGKHPTGGDQARLMIGCPLTHEIAPYAPAALASLVDRMVQLRPARRPQLTELIETFATLSEGI